MRVTWRSDTPSVWVFMFSIILEEYYYILSGRGVMTLDGELFEVKTGDITAVYPGGEHALGNSSDEDLHVVVISIS